jgi:hypothetical protein
MYRDLGNRGGEAETLHERGTLDRVNGQIGQHPAPVMNQQPRGGQRP